jgi:hypothetical protein
MLSLGYGEITLHEIPGSPPPKGWDGSKTAVRFNKTRGSVELDDIVIIEGVPAYKWSFGCTATAASMIAAYYDRNGYDNIYTGPSHDGVMPINDDWGPSGFSGEANSWLNPLAASRQGLDGLQIKGHVDDYWYWYGEYEDPYYDKTNDSLLWEEHEPNCVADFIGTSQWYNWRNFDGASSHYTSPTKLYDYTGSEFGSYARRDAMHGLKLFFESRGYAVDLVYSQNIQGFNGSVLGFSWGEYMREIDNNRPVIIAIEGHSMVGVGYNRATREIYFHNTWDHNLHSMAWGGTYTGKKHYGIGVIHLTPLVSLPSGEMQVNLHLHDSWGDGWADINGYAGINIFNRLYSVVDDADSLITFNLDPDSTYTYSFIEKGTTGNEASWSFTTEAGTLLSRGSGSGLPGRKLDLDFYLEYENSYSDPLPPQNLQITQVDTTLILSWSPVLLDIEGNNISSLPIQYIVLRGDSPDFEIAYADRDTVSTTSYTYIPTSGETLSFFRVIAFYDGSFQMQDYDPLPPNNVYIARNDTLMTISWSPVLLDVEGNNISTKNVKYKLFVCDDPEFEVIETEVIEVDATSYNYAILNQKLKYFRVSAYID